jgi:heme A synthase
MGRTLFIVFILGLSAAIGLTLFGAFMEHRAYRTGVRSKQRVFALIATMIGVAIQAAILMWAIIPNGVVDPSPVTFGFLIGLFIALVGLSGLANTTIKEVAGAEARTARTTAEDRFQEAETGRVTSEGERKAGEEYRERGEEYRETGEKRREEGEGR